MVPKTGNPFPNGAVPPSEREFAHAIGAALRGELGASRRATKTVMVWADVSDRTARGWLHGSHSPGGRHLLALSAHSQRVMGLFLSLAGQDRIRVSLHLSAIESELQEALATIQKIRGAASRTLDLGE